ncbi:hypothetical protein GCM10023152_27560 [Agromyces bauzanensis]|uniref:Uncharacterized protein n=1 Tax=Agromyces bauzanensis TaxID=1308924 RepID=A0A917PUS0_9MICO|nr:hypothetical protein [Agromyces bauzanensis]GGJ92803.1 hypothetical protein GCM10011372_34180 [Agromyces bauzanensis]
MTEAETRERGRWHRVTDILGVFLLSVVAVLTAWCGFEASKWSGEMSIAFSQASSARIQAANADGEARSARSFDLTIYASFLQAVGEGNEELADYIRERFTPEFRVAYDAWVEDGMVEHAPFAREEYVPEGSVEAVELNALADEKFTQALEDNQRGDNYSLLTVLFALVLFLTAMSQRELVPWVGRTLLGLAIVVAVVGVVILTTFPIRI